MPENIKCLPLKLGRGCPEFIIGFRHSPPSMGPLITSNYFLISFSKRKCFTLFSPLFVYFQQFLSAQKVVTQVMTEATEGDCYSTIWFLLLSSDNPFLSSLMLIFIKYVVLYW